MNSGSCMIFVNSTAYLGTAYSIQHTVYSIQHTVYSIAWGTLTIAKRYLSIQLYSIQLYKVLAVARCRAQHPRAGRNGPQDYG